MRAGDDPYSASGNAHLTFPAMPMLPAQDAGLPRKRSKLGEIAQRLGRAAQMVFSGIYGQNAPGWFLRLLLPGSLFDYEKEVGDPWRNSAVAACIWWIIRNFPEPELQVVDLARDNKPQPVPNHPLVQLLSNPNPWYDGEDLWAGILVSLITNGNGYAILSRGAGGAGQPLEIYYVPHFQVTPQWPADGSQFISHYLYRVDGKWFRVETKDILHFRWGINPYIQRLGWNPFESLWREIFTDNEAETFQAALVRNMAIPGLLISASNPEVDLTQEQSDVIKQRLRAFHTGEGRGEPLVLSGNVKVDKLAFSPEELTLDNLRKWPEARICAVLGIPPQVVGLIVGQGIATYANMHEARQAAVEECLIPFQRRIARTLQTQLLPYFGDVGGKRVVWDYTNVRSLQPDMNLVYQRNSTAYQAGWITRGDARSNAGLEYDEKQDDVYLLSSTMQVVPAGEDPEWLPTEIEPTPGSGPGSDSGGDEDGDDEDS